MIRAPSFTVPNPALASGQQVLGAEDAASIPELLALVSNSARLRDVHEEARRKLHVTDDKDDYPRNGCAIFLSCLLARSGIAVTDENWALDLARQLLSRGWEPIEVGRQQPGDVGTTCVDERSAGVDHVYLVADVDARGRMTVVDNQEGGLPHERPVAAEGSYSPTTMFLRPPPMR